MTAGVCPCGSSLGRYPYLQAGQDVGGDDGDGISRHGRAVDAVAAATSAGSLHLRHKPFIGKANGVVVCISASIVCQSESKGRRNSARLPKSTSWSQTTAKACEMTACWAGLPLLLPALTTAADTSSRPSTATVVAFIVLWDGLRPHYSPETFTARRAAHCVTI